MQRLLIAILIASGSAAPVWAADEVENPDWVRRPTPEMLRGVWPTEALKQGKDGRAVISCRVSLQGALYDCKVLSEEPAGLGFGYAAVLMTPQLLMKPLKINGVPQVGTIKIPIKFDVPGRYTGRPGPAAVRPTIAWEQAPSAADIAGSYPRKARDEAVGGMVSLQCRFTYERTLGRCSIMSEEPRGYGFGAAAQEIAKKFVAGPMRPGARPLSDAMVQMPVAFSPEFLKGQGAVVGKPNWVDIPPNEDFQTAFAKPGPASGTVRVALQCVVQQGGSLSGCSVEREEPSGRGYGDAALSLARGFKLSTWTMEGLPVVGGKVNVPLRYEPPAASPPPQP
jgi:TonB family protein